MTDAAIPFTPEDLLDIARTRMPFGRYEGRVLIDLPEPYVVWFAKNGFPDGKLGRLLSLLYDIKLNGLEYLFDPMRIHDTKDEWK